MWFAKVWGIRGSYVEGERGRETKVLDRKLSFLIEFSPRTYSAALGSQATGKERFGLQESRCLTMRQRAGGWEK